MSLFGASNAPKPSLFGSTNTALQPPQQSPSLFGAPPQQLQPFGQATQHAAPQGSLFGSTQQPVNAMNSTMQTQPFGSSNFGATQLAQGTQSTQLQPLWQPASSWSPREKTVPEQMHILLEKWSPDSTNCVFQRYFYNNVDASAVPFYGPSPGEDEQKWEEALSNKPSANDVPVLCKGFASLGGRLQVQVQSVSALQARLHEINNSLTEILQRHNGQISVRAADARRRHVALSQRCLQLATKVQILRNRGYTMDGPEEELKKTLSDLGKAAFDPQLNSRQDEIWARMVGIRERISFLQEQTEKAAIAQDTQADTLDEHLLKTTRKILDDYDRQIIHLQKEISSVKADYEDWEKTEVGLEGASRR